MPVSSYIVKVESDRIGEVQNALTQMGGMEYGEVEGTSFPVAFYAENEEQSKQMGDRIETIPGVLQASLVYHNFEDVSYEETSSKIPLKQ